MTMMKSVSKSAVAVAFGIAILFLAGCGGVSKSSRFYVLSPVGSTENEKNMDLNDMGDITIGISPVSLPKYMKKSQIVTRTGSNELHLAEFDRWAGKIQEDIGRVIAENLANMLSTDKVLSYPAIDVVDTDYTIEMDISRFEGSLGESVELISRWAIFNIQGDTIKSVTSTRIHEQVKGGSYADMVAAQSRALASLSRELADAIIQLSAK
jgi:uncharacterized lipoprotein YmbA